MKALWNWLRNEPVTAIAGAVSAALEVLVAFHVHVTTEQRAAIMGAIPIVFALIARQAVSPTAKAPDRDELAEEFAARIAAHVTPLVLPPPAVVTTDPELERIVNRPIVTVKVLREAGGAGPLGRHVEHDERSRAYAVTPHPETGKAVRWVRRAPIFNQGDVGSCTGNAMAGWVGTDHQGARGNAAERETNALELYTLATTLDAIPGSYPAQDTGSTGLAVAKAAKQLGLIASYQHAFSVDQALAGLARGPVITGTNWLTGMDRPDASGLVHATGSVRGGHEYEVIGYNPDTGLVACCNSWGRGWGHYGRFFMSLDDWARLLKADGDVTVPSAS